MSEQYRSVSMREFEELTSVPARIAQVEASALLEGGHVGLATHRLRAGIEEAHRLRQEILASQPKPESQPAAPAPAPAAPTTATAPTTGQPAAPARGPLASPGTPMHQPVPPPDLTNPHGTDWSARVVANLRAMGTAPPPSGNPATNMALPFGLPGRRR